MFFFGSLMQTTVQTHQEFGGEQDVSQGLGYETSHEEDLRPRASADIRGTRCPAAMRCSRTRAILLRRSDARHRTPMSSLGKHTAKMYDLAVIRIPATQARQRWAQTMDSARRSPVTITDHGRESVMVLDVEVAHRALQALEDAEDAAAADAALAAIEAGEETVPLEDVARELGLTLE